jgi:hypothetical protein
VVHTGTGCMARRRFQPRSRATLSARITTRATAVAGSATSVVTAKVTSTITAEPMARTGSQLPAPVSWRTRKWPADTRANTFWVSYGALIGQPAMCLSAGFGLACAIVMCVILRARRTVPPVTTLTGLRPAVAVSMGRLARSRLRSADARPVCAAAA